MIFFEYIAGLLQKGNDYLAQLPYISSYLNEIVFAISIIAILIFYFKSRILERYLMKELLSPFLVTLSTITFVLLLDEIMDLMKLIMEKDLDFLTIINIFGLALPFLLALSIPMAVLMASILTFGRLSVDSEIVAIKSGGVNIFKTVRPIYFLALLLSLFMVYFNNKILPETNHKFSNLRTEISMQTPMKIISPGEFIQFGAYTVLVQDIDDEFMYGIVIYDRSDTKFPKTIVAKKGKIIPIENGVSLKAILYNGQMHDRDAKNDKKYSITSFQEFILNITGLEEKIVIAERTNRSDREMSSSQLVSAIELEKEKIIQYDQSVVKLEEAINKLEKVELDSSEGRVAPMKIKSNINKIKQNKQEKEYSQERIRAYTVEYHKKYALAFACLIFVIMGIPIGIMTKSSGIGVAFSVSSLIFLIYYVSLIGGERLADKGIVDPALSMWISNIFFGALGIYLTYAAKFEKSFLDFSRFSLSGLFKRKKSNENA